MKNNFHISLFMNKFGTKDPIGSNSSFVPILNNRLPGKDFLIDRFNRKLILNIANIYFYEK